MNPADGIGQIILRNDRSVADLDQQWSVNRIKSVGRDNDSLVSA